MPMSHAIAEQVAALLNSQNQLTVPYTAGRVLEHEDDYVLRFHGSELVGVVEVKRVQWYQCEVAHLSVGPKRQGVGSGLVKDAEARARGLGARLAQCTIRVGNTASEILFRKAGYFSTATFFNEPSGNAVTVYQKVLTPVPEGNPNQGPAAGETHLM